MQVLHRAILGAIPWVPRRVIRRVAGRYIAGESMDDVLRVASDLHAEGLLSTVDVLGENVDSESSARLAEREYLRLVDRLSGAGLPSQASLKLSLVGLRVREDLASDCALGIAKEAEEKKITVCLDMEDSSTTDATIRVFRRLRERHEGVSLAIQAYLHRSVDDLRSLLPLRPSVRICKGIYNEPPQKALKDRREIRQNYLRLLELLLEAGGYPAIATHDPWLIHRALHLLRSHGGGPMGHEFQMLLGVGESLRPLIRSSGSRLRIYCPYGPDWYAYSLRRLRENPEMAAYALKSLFSTRTFRGTRLR